jgi:endonuclease YncB( thermonuclease family)
MTRHPAFASLAHPRRGGILIVGGAIFAFGVAVGTMAQPTLARRLTVGVAPALAATPEPEPRPAAEPLAHRLDRQIVYPVDVLRIIDGDTFEARVRVWPGLDVDTKVRLRGIDAAELHARCADELAKAQAARTALDSILAQGGVALSQVGIDKYGGRIDATVSTRSTADVSAAMLSGGFARSYDGGRRGSWCG